MTPNDAYELLSDPLLLLPKRDGAFEPYLRELFEHFVKNMREATPRLRVPSRGHVQKIESLIDRLLAAVDLSTAGKEDEALHALGDGLSNVQQELFLVSERNTSVMTGQTLYRLIRRYPDMNEDRRSSVFHIPFEKRELASAVRYSIKGHPSLYLGNSIYLCWLECDSPEDLSEWFAARFDLDFGRLKVLDLSASTAMLKYVLELSARPPVPSLKIEPGEITNSPTGENWQEYLEASLTVWPLLAACSISAVHSNGTSKPEYAIPQLAMKWVQQNHDVGAVRFFSTREQAIRSTQDISINYALPAKATDRGQGHDNFLMSVAQCTYPVSIGEFQKRVWQAPDDAEAYKVAEHNWRRLTVPEEHGGYRYFGTWYCNLEYELDKYATERIETD